MILINLQESASVWTKEKQEYSDKRLAILIGRSPTIPIIAPSDPDWLLYVQSFQPEATVPHPRKITAIISSTAESLREKFRERLGSARRVSATTDGWSTSNYNDSYLGKL